MCLFIFFSYVEDLEKDVEKVAVAKTINEINSALAVFLYQLTIKKELEQLNLLKDENPFLILAQFSILPRNYGGAVNSIDNNTHSGAWYYILDTKRLVYIFLEGDKTNEYALTFDYDDNNRSGEYEPNLDQIKRLSIKYIQTKKIAGT